MKYNIEDDDKRREKEEQIGRHEVCMCLGSNLREIFHTIGVLNCSKDPGLKLTKRRRRTIWKNEVCMRFRLKFVRYSDYFYLNFNKCPDLEVEGTD